VKLCVNVKPLEHSWKGVHPHKHTRHPERIYSNIIEIANKPLRKCHTA